MNNHTHTTYTLTASDEKQMSTETEIESDSKVRGSEDIEDVEHFHAYNDGQAPKPPKVLRVCTMVLFLFLVVLAITTVLGLKFGKGSAGKLQAEDSGESSDSTSGVPANVSDNSNGANENDLKPRMLKPKIIEVLPHDPGAFTQGFEYHDGYFWESTGLYGESTLRKVEVESGVVKMKQEIDGQYFGEGMTYLKDRNIIAMLTWKKGKGFLFNASNFEQLDTFSYKGEGWGLATDHSTNPPTVYMSDGTPTVRLLDPSDMNKTQSTFTVTDAGKKVESLNEIEYLCGELWGNIWTSNRIARINPKTGKVKSWIDVTGVLPREEDRTSTMNVLNGIAFDSKTGRLWFTGKKWSKIYQVNISDPSLDLKSCR